MPEKKHSKPLPPSNRPYNCDLSARNNIHFKIDQLGATELKDSIVSGRNLKWLGMGDIVDVKIPRDPTEAPKLTICDADRKHKHLRFKKDFTVPFECLCLSDFTQYYRFSAVYDDTTYQFEFFRQRIPEIEVDVSKKDNANVYSARVEMFINNLSGREATQVSLYDGGNGGGWQLRGTR